MTTTTTPAALGMVATAAMLPITSSFAPTACAWTAPATLRVPTRQLAVMIAFRRLLPSALQRASRQMASVTMVTTTVAATGFVRLDCGSSVQDLNTLLLHDWFCFDIAGFVHLRVNCNLSMI